MDTKHPFRKQVDVKLTAVLCVTRIIFLDSRFRRTTKNRIRHLSKMLPVKGVVLSSSTASLLLHGQTRHYLGSV